MPKKTESGDFLGFFNIHSVANIEKMKGDPLGIFFEKSLTMSKKTERGDPLVSPGILCYAKKKKNFSSSVR